MANSALMRRIANEVETLITQNGIAVERFKEQLKVFNDACGKYWKARENELLPTDTRPDKSKRDAYEYDPSCEWWFPKDSPTLPPDPAKWELADKLPCYYATLALIYDSEKGKLAPFRLCEGILDNFVFAWMQRLLLRASGFDKDMLDTALKWVKADIRTQQEGTNASKISVLCQQIINKLDEWFINLNQEIEIVESQKNELRKRNLSPGHKGYRIARTRYNFARELEASVRGLIDKLRSCLEYEHRQELSNRIWDEYDCLLASGAEWDHVVAPSYPNAAFGNYKRLVDTLSNVAELAGGTEPAVTEQKVPLGTCRKIWNRVKAIPRWIYVLVIFLAALLTCIYLSWWLWTTFWKK